MRKFAVSLALLLTFALAAPVGAMHQQVHLKVAPPGSFHAI